MLTGLILALTAGALVSLQNIFNSKVNDHTGKWATTTLVLGMGFAASAVMGLLLEGTNMFTLRHMQPWYWFSGIIGVGVVICLVQATKMLGATYAIAIVLTSQLGFALLFDSLGWLGLSKVPFSWNQGIGVLVIVGGILVFKLGGNRAEQKAAKREPENHMLRADQSA
ncbi:DMT family transporter [Paenibacillus sp. NFR01]|uniref:DMT family transporter n=1 Tax=Paenibacillus sp. NFR01 TaxID=1566279 RepID=UPI0008CF508A|nr:DMT family transporter [Paenibacillus sp. NFR01]SET19396.1 transporter family-2 protein [Paenibacillus sp. NFR01]